MSSKEDGKCSFDSKSADDGDEKESYDGYDKPEPPKIDVTSVKFDPVEAELTAALRLNIVFELDRDAVAAYWVVQFLVDSSHRRIIKILGETPVEDYPDGESEMSFSVDDVNVSGISPSTLANSGLLMAIFMVDGEEVASVNMVLNIYFKFNCVYNFFYIRCRLLMYLKEMES